MLNGKDVTATDAGVESPEKSISRIFRRSTKLTPSTNTAESSDNTLMRKSLMFLAPGAIEKMSIKEHNVEEPSDGQVRIAVKFASVNFLDLLKKQGIYPKSGPYPFVAGSELSGIIDAVGPNVENFKVGDRVVAVDSNGCFTSSHCVDENKVLVLPDIVSFEEGASIFVTYVTAYDLLFTMGSIKSNQIILLPQAAGGVGNAVIQLAKTVPDVTIIAICSKSKHEYIKSLGVQHTIDYRTQDYVTEVKKISPKGVDLVLDSMNGEDSTKSFNLLKPFGKVIHYGMTNFSGAERSIFRSFKGWFKCLSMNSLTIINTNKMMAGYNLNYIAEDDFDHIREVINILITMLGNGQIKPVIDSIYPFTKAKDAFTRMFQRGNVGKILLSPDATEESILTATS
ncbi:hypothetical protein GJ496_009454 [Pomphorhynchus laevis]|nr:hypothetical protein GJ496_009454 [Pomphorhynchus laevis]